MSKASVKKNFNFDITLQSYTTEFNLLMDTENYVWYAMSLVPCLLIYQLVSEFDFGVSSLKRLYYISVGE